MYMPYLMYGYASVLVLMLVGCCVLSRTVPGLRGIPRLEWGFVCGLLGLVLLALRLVVPAWATILAANEAIFVAYLLMYCATAEILDIRPRFLSWAMTQLAAALAGNWYYTYLHPALVPRILIGSGSIAIYAAAQAILLSRYKKSGPEEAAPAIEPFALVTSLVWLQGLVIALHVARGTLTLLYPPTEIVRMDLIQSGLTYLNLVLNAAAGCGLTWLSLSMHRVDLQRIACTDSLTGLLNRRAFEQILARELDRAHRSARSLVLLLIDIDRFKQVNDTWGHQAGDEVIRRVAETLGNSVRPADALCRQGGEEFAVLLREATEEQSEEIAGRIREEIAGLINLPGSVQITVSIGVASSNMDDEPSELMRRCDEALYRSKRGGRNLVTVDRSRPSPRRMNAHASTA